MSNRGNSRGNPGRGDGGGRGGGRGSGQGDRGGYPPRGSGSGFGGRGSPSPSGRGYDGGGRAGSPSGSGFRGRSGPPTGGGRGGRGFSGGGGSVIFAENAPAQIPPRLSEQKQQQLIAAFKSVKKTPERPLRPGFGTLGTPVTLRANFFALRVPKGPLYEYAIGITPKPESGGVKMRIFTLLEETPGCQPHLPYIAHDKSERLISARELPQELNIEVPFYEDYEAGPKQNAKVYLVSITFQRELNTGDLTEYLEGKPGSKNYDTLPLISALNLVLQQHSSRNGIRVGKNRYFFPSDLPRFNVGRGLEGQQGFFVSVRPTFGQLMVNVNSCMAAFVEPGNLVARLLQFQDRSSGAMPTLPPAMVKSIKVRTQHLHHKRQLSAIGSTSARNTFFDCAEFGGKISVEEFFRKKYKITLKYPNNLPVVDIGSRKRRLWIPAELCDIELGNAYKGKIGDTSLVNHASRAPRLNAEAITQIGFPILGLSPHKGPVAAFDLSIDTNMSVIPGRELPPPSLSYKGSQMRANNGSWNIMNVKFHRGAVVGSWWVLVLKETRGRQEDFVVVDNRDPRLKELVEGFANKLKASGVTMPSALPRLLPIIELPKPNDDPGRLRALTMIRNVLRSNLEQIEKQRAPRPNFMLVLLEQRDNYIYPGMKRIGEVELGIQTIHMQLPKVFADSGNSGKRDQYLSNVALKVNTKLGGINHLLEQNAMRWLTKHKTMMVGIDVTHPGPLSKEGTPSIAAVVASVDDMFVQFPASLRIQESKKEMLDELTDMLVERLLVYEKKNKVLPERIFVYRDGVSEGQFDTVLQDELPQIQESFKRLSTKERKAAYNPKLSIIICGKRHHARLYATNSQFADKNGNTRPGTVVDRGITGVFDFDFYLQAHAGIKGQVKATHYTVVYDENALTADDVQQGTNNASYLYARATKAVSLIPAAYYADLACERGRCYLNDFLSSEAESTAGGSGGIVGGRDPVARQKEKEREMKRVYDAAKKAWGDGLHRDVRESMFYI